jgi:hypothetical protein
MDPIPVHWQPVRRSSQTTFALRVAARPRVYWSRRSEAKADLFAVVFRRFGCGYAALCSLAVIPSS